METSMQFGDDVMVGCEGGRIVIEPEQCWRGVERPVGSWSPRFELDAFVVESDAHRGQTLRGAGRSPALLNPAAWIAGNPITERRSQIEGMVQRNGARLASRGHVPIVVWGCGMEPEQ